MVMVAIESQHENLSDRMFWGICEPKYNGFWRELPVNTFKNPLYRGSQIPQNMLSDLFSCCDSIATIPMP